MDQVAEVKSKVDLVEVISSYLPLKKAGRNFAGLCPFHSEKTPSFMISPERQVFKCFGCGEAGDVYTFLMKTEGWDFREALEELAKRAGVKLKDFAPTAQLRTKETIISVCILAAKFYNYLLLSHPTGEKARKYLLSRGIKRDLWEKFSLGYSPEGWEKTLQFLTKRKFSISDLSIAGLVVSRNTGGSSRGFYDRFRDRLMFPLKDSRGTILGFSGRVIVEGATRDPKYTNSPETAVFNKGSILFGFDITRAAIRDKNEAVLVEGEFDLLSSYQIGVENVVASKGTALTSQQVALLSRACESVVLCYDSDLAGDAAARRGIELLDLAGTSVKVGRLGKHKDPDELAQKEPQGLKKAIAEAVNIYDYFIDSARLRYNPATVDGKKKIGREILPILSKISDEIVRAYYVERLASVLDLDVNLVAASVNKKAQEIEVSGYETSDSTKNALSSEEYFLALFISQDEILTPAAFDLAPRDFEKSQARDFWQWISDIIKASKSKSAGALSLKKILKKLPATLSQFVDDLYLVNISPLFSERELWAEELSKVAGRIKVASWRRRLVKISKAIGQAQKQADNNLVLRLTKQFDQVSKYLEGAKT